MTEEGVAILLVDDHEVVRMGLKTLLDRREGFSVVGEAGSVAEAVSAAQHSRPDVIVMDIRLPDGNGVEACREIRGDLPDTKVIMLTSYADDEAVYGSIMAGASGYLLKQTRGQNLAEAIDGTAVDPHEADEAKRVSRGERFLPDLLDSFEQDSIQASIAR